MKTKILATLYTIIVFVIMIFIGYIVYFFPDRVIPLLCIISGILLIISVWFKFYNHLKK